MKVEVYTSVEEMKQERIERPISPVESLIYSLNLMNFYATLNRNNPVHDKRIDNIEWIELKFIQ